MLDAARNSGELKPYLGNRSVQWRRFDLSAVGTVPLSRADMGRFRLKSGDLLVCEGGEVGRGAIWRGELPECYYQKALHRLRSQRGYDPRIMLALLEYWSSRNNFANYVTQTSIAHLPRDKFQKMPLPLIPDDEQERIAEFLEDFDEQIAAIDRLVAKKQAIMQGMMQQLLTGMTRLSGFAGSWSQVSVGEVSEVKTGPFGSALHESDYVSRGTPIITVEHLGERGVVAEGAPLVSEADRNRLRAYALKAGDVVFSRVGSIDRNALISGDEEGWLFSGRLLRVRFDKSKADPAFMSSQFHSEPFRDAVRAVAVGQTMPSLNTAILRAISVTLPPMPEQVAIGQVATDLNHEIDYLYSRLTKARAVKQGMMQELLTGRTRLPAEIVS